MRRAVLSAVHITHPVMVWHVCTRGAHATISCCSFTRTKYVQQTSRTNATLAKHNYRRACHANDVNIQVALGLSTIGTASSHLIRWHKDCWMFYQLRLVVPRWCTWACTTTPARVANHYVGMATIIWDTHVRTPNMSSAFGVPLWLSDRGQSGADV